MDAMIDQIRKWWKECDEIPYRRIDLLIKFLLPDFEQFVVLSGVFGAIMYFMYGWRIMPIH